MRHTLAGGSGFQRFFLSLKVMLGAPSVGTDCVPVLREILLGPKGGILNLLVSESLIRIYDPGGCLDEGPAKSGQ